MMESSLSEEVSGGGEPPLGEKFPGSLEVKNQRGYTLELTGATELHRLAVEDPVQLERRAEEIMRAILDATCSMTLVNGCTYKEVRHASLPNSSPGDATVPRLLLQSLGLGAAAAEQGRKSQQGNERVGWCCGNPPVLCCRSRLY